MTSEVLDEAFGACKERLIPFFEKIQKSPKKIRTDFLYRTGDPEEAGKARKVASHTDAASILSAAHLQLPSTRLPRGWEDSTPASQRTIIRTTSCRACTL